ncbi:hypothetical protein EIP91_007701 [Steccherinum ochraceum]|uniref:Uncharacterized protein n=1 Tax=Steccherinum ochraceum TaxID=92696 RepID=A0A4R0R6K0_9APHY|nr:hypothetical protein EIP91_007701 [Steccherinum ochraceum]
MVDWRSPKVQEICLFVFGQSLVLMLGVYCWEFALTLPDVELALISKKLRFRWILVPYLFARYAMFGNLLFLTVYLNVVPAENINCAVMGQFFSVYGTMMIACASTNLLIRTVTIWTAHKLIFYFLIAASVGQWVMTFFAGFGDGPSAQSSSAGGCHFDPGPLSMFYYYTVGFDFTILVLTMVYGQGIIYFAITFVVNVPILILASLRLNTTMTVIANIPAATISVICSSRFVTTLLHYQTQQPKKAVNNFTSYRVNEVFEEETEDYSSNAHALTTNICVSGGISTIPPDSEGNVANARSISDTSRVQAV